MCGVFFCRSFAFIEYRMMSKMLLVNIFKHSLIGGTAVILFSCGTSVGFDNTRIHSLNIEAKEYFKQGVEYARENRPDEAIGAYTRSIRISPSAAAYSNRSIEYRRKGLLDRALSDASKAIYLSPHYADAYFTRGNAYVSKNDIDRAIKDYARAIELDPGQAVFYFNCGLAYDKSGSPEKAAAMYQGAVKADPKFFAAYYNLACIFSHRKDVAKALEYLGKAASAGYHDAERLRQEACFGNIRNTAAFRALLYRMKKKAARSQ
jgi:tetratricopeptide (TPR) repeat protein